MLTAVAIGGNNEIFVIAFGIVDTESIDSWSYFFRNLRCLFVNEGCQKDDWTFISDRMRGVESALYDVFPRATRRVCYQHLYSDCKNAANAYNDFVYEKAMSKIKEHDVAAEQYLRNVDEQWSRHNFDTKAVDTDPNDLTEYAQNILKIRGDESRLCHATSCGGGAAYKATYANYIHPMADPTHWPSFNVPHINPPTVKRSAGRPTK
ncbi:Protein FAR1-RELATED SEQUENCE 8 [Bienertia sinuspersici]